MIFAKQPKCLSKKRNDRVLLFQTLNTPTLAIACILTVFFQVYYLKLSKNLKKKTIIVLLEMAGIRILKYENAHASIGNDYMLGTSRITQAVFDCLFRENASFNSLKPLFPNIDDFSRKFEIIVKSHIESIMGDLPQLLLWADSFLKQDKKKVFLFTTNILAPLAAGAPSYTFTNLFPSSLCFLALFFKIMAIILKSVLGYAKRGIKTVFTDQNKAGRVQTNSVLVDYSDYEILFFPHQGVAYGNLFYKDHFYLDSPESPFYRQKIMHIEMYGNSVLGSDGYGKIVDSYVRNRIPFCLFASSGSTGAFSTVRPFLSLLIRNYKTIFRLLDRCKSVSIALIGFIYFRFMNHTAFLERFIKAKIALIGYDFLFPQTISLALESKNITTVATQERYMSPFYPTLRIIMDHYLVSSSYIAEKIRGNNDSYSIPNVVPIGLIRLDLIHGYKTAPKDERIAAIKKKYHVVLALDYHSEESEIDNYSSAYNNWLSNKHFYKELIKLAFTFPEIFIIIRGKNDVWCNIPDFKDIYEIICGAPNMEINRDYDEYNVSYKLVASVNSIIARYTSLVEESLAAGVPVFICDYFPMGNRFFSGVFDHEKYPVFVNSFQELESRFKRLLSSGEYMPDRTFKQMRNMLYGDFFDGKVKERLHAELTKIYLNKIKEDENWLR